MEELAMAYSSPASSSTQTPCEIEEIEMENQRSSDGASSSSTAAVDKYDVFINHRGEVKKSFAGHLYRALLLRGLRPFLDEKDLQEGESFPSQLEDVIRNASVHVAVFSPKYAESFWCLHELLLMRQSGAPIIPVFYHVNPADLRRTDQNKTKGYGLSLHQVEEKKRYDPATIQEWRDALSFVADKSGFDLNGKYNGDEVRMIDEIVECVGKMIRKPGLYVAEHPTGLNSQNFNASCCANLTISSEAFGNIRTLEHMDLSGCEKVEVWPSQLGHQMSLKVVKLIGTNLKKELASAFELPSDLEVLWIGNSLLETVTPSLGDLRKLKELRLEYRGELKCLSASVEGSSQLSWLKVAASPIIHTSEVFFDEVEYPNLKELILKECINLVGIGTLPEALTRVKLSSCYNLRSIEGLCGLPMLRELHIKKCNELEELPSVEAMVSLEKLYATDCAKLKSIRDLAQLTKLEHLKVRGCPQLGELEGVECCRSLWTLYVEGCPKLRWDERVVERLRQQCGIEFRLEEASGS